MIMKVTIRCIYDKAVTPSCDIVEMDGDIWREFLFPVGTRERRLH